MGSFFLIDPISHRPAVAGMIDVSLRRATNIHWQRSAVDKSVRARLKAAAALHALVHGSQRRRQIDDRHLVERRQAEIGPHAAWVDGDNLGDGFNRVLTRPDRSEIGGDALGLPVAVAGRLGSLRSLQLLRPRLGLRRSGLPARLGFGQRALGCRRERLAIGNGGLVTHRLAS
jgi:hypothetical protein